MKAASLPQNEKQRIEALLRYNILDTEVEEAYNEIVELASYICGTPISLISFVDPNRQWFKATVGLTAKETPRDLAFCAHAILQDEVFVVPDACLDDRFVDNPLVTQAPSVRFYAGAPLLTSDGFALGTLCAIDSIPRNLTEAQLKALQTLAKQVINQLELRSSFNLLQKHAQQLHELNANKDKFFSIISHDLRAPFNGLMGLADILSSELDSLSKTEIQEITNDLHASAHNAFKLVENLLQWSMLETGTMACQPSLIQVDTLVNTIISVLSGGSTQKLIQLAAKPNPEAMVWADANMLHSILQNLVTNAVKFTPPYGVIQIASQIKGELVEISVTDTGVGMKPEQLQRLFCIETSFTTQGTCGETGTGLGLLLCKQFVEKNGGTLWVESELGKGTKFTFTVPKAMKS